MRIHPLRRTGQRAPSHSTRPSFVRFIALVLAVVVVAAACGSDSAVVDEVADTAPATETSTETETETSTETETETSTETETEASTDAAAAGDVSVEVRESGLTVTVQPVGDVTVHTLTAPESVFANSTHIIETSNALVLVDTQFLLPNALDFRAYADGLGKPIDRVFISHEHPDHFLGSEAFADVDVFSLSSVSDKIAAAGDAEVAEKQADFGDAIASSFVVPNTVEPGTIEIDGVEFVLEEVVDAEAETQLVLKVPSAGVVAVGDIVYSGVHLILAGSPPAWTTALESLKADAGDYPIVLAGHGLPATPDAYDANIAWLATAGELLGTVDNFDDFKNGLVDAFPELGMDAAIDFVQPFLFPDTDNP